MKFSKKLSITRTLIVAMFLGLIVVPSLMMAWETPVTVGGTANHKYGKPEIKFGPSGTVYMTFRDRYGANSDIILCTYDGKEYKYENASNLAELWSSHDAYQAALVVDQNETIHVAWIGMNLNDSFVKHHIMYRYKDENGWSQVYNFGSVHEEHNMLDTRLAVDSSGNVHIITMKEGEATTWYVAKYGDVITNIEQIGGSKYKHPDIAVNDDYIYMLYQIKMGYPYVQVLQKRENKLGGATIFTKQITSPKEPYASQKGRIEFGSDGSLHLLDFYKGSPTSIDPKMMFYYEVDSNGTLKNETLVSKPGPPLLYHYAGLSVRENSIIASMQLGSSSSGGAGLFYNWKKNGEWEGYTYIPGTSRALHQSIDLSEDGMIAAVTWITPDNKIHFSSTEPISATGQLEAEFTSPSDIYYGSEVTFDASLCTSLNPDYAITKYIWDFNGVRSETDSPTITHKFEDGISFRTNVVVILTIETENAEQTGLIEKEVFINANYNASNVTKKFINIRTLIYNRAAIKVMWEKNSKNSAVTINKYQIWRAFYGGFLAFSLVGEFDSNTFEFFDFTDIDSTKNYIYIISTVDSEGHISPAVGNNQ